MMAAIHAQNPRICYCDSDFNDRFPDAFVDLVILAGRQHGCLCWAGVATSLVLANCDDIGEHRSRCADSAKPTIA
ncbi:MAG: hypothetical protein M1546_16640 [Chloroflexi bacterium]|nr:hypothetical protein [Chloroflexota bacterium]